LSFLCFAVRGEGPKKESNDGVRRFQIAGDGGVIQEFAACRRVVIYWSRLKTLAHYILSFAMSQAPLIVKETLRPFDKLRVT